MAGVEIEVRGLRKAWGDTTAVDGVSFSAPAGRFTVLLGPSGCGKSTILRLIAGLESATEGAVLIDGRDVVDASPKDRGVAMVFQSYALFPHLDVAENILFGLKVRRVATAERAARLERTAALLGLSELLGRKPSQLSGGQQQRVALGRAIIAEKPICLMDEPLSNLDAKLRHEMRVEIRALQQKLGLTMVYVTHDQAEAISMADKIVVLNQGRIEQSAPPQEIYDRPASMFAARFIGTPPMNILTLERRTEGWAAAGGGPVLAAAATEAEALAFGVRPEDVALAEPGAPMVCEAEVEAVEYLGADHLIDCRIGAERLTARVSPRRPARVGETVALFWRPEHTHLFDATSGARLSAPSAPGASFEEGTTAAAGRA